jgi:hypothetical protein
LLAGLGVFFNVAVIGIMFDGHLEPLFFNEDRKISFLCWFDPSFIDGDQIEGLRYLDERESSTYSRIFDEDL